MTEDWTKGLTSEEIHQGQMSLRVQTIWDICQRVPLDKAKLLAMLDELRVLTEAEA